MTDIVILSAPHAPPSAPSAAALAAIPPIALGATVAAAPRWSARASSGGQIGHVAFGHVINTEPRDMYLSPRGRDGGGRARHGAGDERQPALRVGRAGDRVGRAVAAAGRRRLRACGRRRKHEPVALHPARGALGPEDGRRGRAGHDAGRAELPVRHRPHGRDGRERRGRARHQPRRPGRLRAGKPDPRRDGHRRGAVHATRSCRSR